MTGKKGWIVTISDSRSLSDIVKEMREAGFTVQQELHEIRCITGTASDDVAQKVRHIDGVTSIEPDRSVDIGPPDSDTTW